MARHLPEQFELPNRLAFLTYGLLQDHVVAGEKAKLLNFAVELRSEEHAEALKGLGGEALWDWLSANGYSDAVANHHYRHLVFALVSDLCQFTYEALACSEKGKLTVSYALLRKPLQDNLFFLEWLLVDRADFLDKFRQGPEHLDLGRMAKELSKVKRIDIIGRAMDTTPAGRWLSPDVLYKIRYEKAAAISFDRLFNRALHLVTTHKGYATEPENINFIFADDETRFGLWRYLYHWLPALLRHTLHVVRELFKTLDPEFEPFDHLAELWLTVGFLLWTEKVDDVDGKNAAAEFFQKTFDEEPLKCPACMKRLVFDTPNMMAFWERGEVECRACQAPIPLLDPAEVVGEDLAKDAQESQSSDAAQ